MRRQRDGLIRALVSVACAVVGAMPGFAPLAAQSLAAATAARTFEVASVKPRDPANPRTMMVADPSGDSPP
jgi:hypothetical protein